ncbi:MAG: hypothetical protein ACSLFQ_12325 [Thermoanaerobaculia bacterium]
MIACLPVIAAAQALAPEALFSTADRCTACHNGLLTPAGEDVSIGTAWRGSMMANAARDPYWQAAVRRETIDHPAAAAAIENECSACHMPMTRFAAKAGGGMGSVFAHLPIAAGALPADLLAADGVSCSVCHQIKADGLGTDESFTAGFVIDPTPAATRSMFGPYEVAPGHRKIMDSAAAFTPEQRAHIRDAEICASCHTLHTHALDAEGKPAGRLTEQGPYLEWRHSAYVGKQTCQECHMPPIADGTAISSVLPVARDGARMHRFRGGNFLMPRILALHAVELGVAATPAELTATAERTADHLRQSSARLSFAEPRLADGRLELALTIENRAGHKLPTAYPSRRAWVHLTVRDAGGSIVFESGALEPTGAIRGNDNDVDGTRYEPHHSLITREEQVQIYEPILADSKGEVTTGLIRAVRYVKDNRILPDGFDKTTAHDDVAVRGAAMGDPDFAAGRDTVRYSIDTGEASGPFSVTAELWYQPIGFRWATNLAEYDTPESIRFGGYFRELADESALKIGEASVDVR